MSRLIPKLALVFVTQGVLAWFFYRSRVVSHSSWADSDLVVFVLPLVIGLAASNWVLFYAFRRVAASKRLAIAFGLSTVGAFISSYVGTVIAFNLYGT